MTITTEVKLKEAEPKTLAGKFLEWHDMALPPINLWALPNYFYERPQQY